MIKRTMQTFEEILQQEMAQPVRIRCIDGTHPELVRIYVEEMKSPPLTDEEVEELREEMRKINEQLKQ